MQITSATAPITTPPMISWPTNPYKGLSFFTSVDAGLFGARETEVQACAQIVIEEDLKVLLLYGTTGCGKSSFLRAGLIPYLESTVRQFQFLRTFDAANVRTLFIRCTEAPLQRLCETLYDWSATPLQIELPDTAPRKISLLPIRGQTKTREEFVAENANSVENLINVLSVVGNLLPRTVVFVFDQGEEILTLDQQDEKGNRSDFFDFLIAFTKVTIDMKFIVAFRKEYFGDFHPELESRDFHKDKLRTFQLPDLSNRQLVEAIKIPTSRKIPAKYLQGRQQPGEHYNFEFEFGLPERIVADLQKTKTSGGVLPVLQITCERLYRIAKKREDRTLLTFGSRPLTIDSSDYEKLGPPDTQVRQYIDESIEAGIAEQSPKMKGFDLEDERDRWKDVLHWMVYKQSDNTALTRICSEAEIRMTAEKMECMADFGRMARFLSSDDRRILRNDPRGEKATSQPLSIFAGMQPQNDSATMESDTQYYSLGHDAIAVELDYWGSARNVIKTRQGFLRRIVEISYKAAAVYVIGIALVIGYVSSDGFDKYLFGAVFFFVVLGAGMWVMSGRIARRMSGLLIRSKLFQTFLTSRPAE